MTIALRVLLLSAVCLMGTTEGSPFQDQAPASADPTRRRPSTQWSYSVRHCTLRAVARLDRPMSLGTTTSTPFHPAGLGGLRGGEGRPDLPDDISSPTTAPLASTLSSDRWAEKLSHLQERTGPAVALLLGLWGVIRFFGSAGLSALVLLLSPVLYHEMVSMVLGTTTDPVGAELRDTVTAPEPTEALAGSPLTEDGTMDAVARSSPPADTRVSNQWWWFLAMSLPTTLSGYLSARIHTATLPLVSYAMMLTGWMAWILRLNASHSNTSAHFAKALKELSVYHVAGWWTILPVNCWMATMSEFTTGQSWVLYAAMLVILNDTLAYLFGVSFGKHALLPVISPKKTWEGWIGALLSTTLFSYLVWRVFFSVSYGADSLVVALFCSLVAPFGGFVASAVKRACHRKDFGNLIAGHGGLVDRLDCQLITAPFVYLFLKAMEPSDVFANKYSAFSSHAERLTI